MSKRVDGLFLQVLFVENTSEHNNDYIINAAKDVPIVLVNGYLDAANIYSVMCNDEEAVYNATKLLINNSHRNIVYLYTSTSYSGMNKYRGYLKAINEAGITLRMNSIICVARTYLMPGIILHIYMIKV
ncbi:MAG: hypothetical protein ACLS9K_13645 [Lachnospira eligens]